MSRHYDYALMSDFVYKLGDDKYKNYARYPEYYSNEKDYIDYKSQENELSNRGWEMISTSQQYNIGTDANYFGAAFRHKETEEVVIAHRGSILRNEGRPNAEMALFIILGYIPLFILQPCFDYIGKVGKIYRHNKITMTGHSLGGYLAGAGAIVLKALNLNVKATTFDSLGVDLFLEKFKDELEAMNWRQYVGNLDDVNEKIVNYLSSPNFVNTGANHIGKKRRLFVGNDPTNDIKQFLLPSYNELKQQHQFSNSLGETSLNPAIPALLFDLALTFTNSHPMANLLPAFNKKTGNALEYGDIKRWPEKGTSFFDREEEYDIIYPDLKKLISKVLEQIKEPSFIQGTILPLVSAINNLAANQNTEDQSDDISASSRIEI
jgi:hypothetical protein